MEFWIIGLFLVFLVIGFFIGSSLSKPKQTQLVCPPSQQSELNNCIKEKAGLSLSHLLMTEERDCYRANWLNERQAIFNILNSFGLTNLQKIQEIIRIRNDSLSKFQACDRLS